LDDISILDLYQFIRLTIEGDKCRDDLSRHDLNLILILSIFDIYVIDDALDGPRQSLAILV
jgi:hypothetical protein